MKKQLFIIVLIFVCNAAAMAQSKIAHVNTKTLLDTIPSRKKAIKEIQEVTKQGEAELIEMDKQLEKAYNDYMGKKAEQSQTVNQYEEARLQKLQQSLQERQQELEANIQKLNQSVSESTYKLVKDAVKAVAAKKSFQYVIDQESALFSGGTDITSEVIAEILKLDALTVK